MSSSTKKPVSTDHSVELSNGVKFTFSGLMAGDLLDAVKQLGCSLEEADSYESSMVLTWRTAVRGGYEGDFRSFVDQIPMAEVQKVVEGAAPFLRTSTPSK